MRFILFVLFLFPVVVCSQQILSLEEYGQVISNGTGVPESVTYLKDINNSLDQYIGTWVGTQNGKTITFVVSQSTNEWLEGLDIDQLIIRYKIVDVNGQVLVDGLGHADDAGSIIEGEYFLNNVYTLRYYFAENPSSPHMDLTCGTHGILRIERFVDASGVIKMDAFFSPANEMYVMDQCPNGIINIPLEMRDKFILRKQ